MDATVAVGERREVEVLEVAHRLNEWRVWVDGKPVGRPVYLPRSHGRWQPVVTAESWSGGSAACNAYSYRFDNVRIADSPGGGWHRLTDHYAFSDSGYGMSRRGTADFVAFRAPAAHARRELVGVRR